MARRKTDATTRRVAQSWWRNVMAAGLVMVLRVDLSSSQTLSAEAQDDVETAFLVGHVYIRL